MSLQFEIQCPRPPSDMEGFSYSDGPIHVAWPHDANLHIGKFCSIARNLRVFLGGNHPIHCVSAFPFSWRWSLDHPEPGRKTKGDVVIGNDVWIGDSVVIMSGSNIGHGAVIGAYSVVAGYIPPYAVAAGNPARVRRYRFAPEIIEQLLKLSWWDWPEEKIREAVPLLQSENVHALLEFGRGAA